MSSYGLCDTLGSIYMVLLSLFIILFVDYIILGNEDIVMDLFWEIEDIFSVP